MKRVFLEWCSLFCIVFSLVCLLFWSVSLLSDSEMLGLSFGKQRAIVQTFTRKGDVTFCDHVANLEMIESVKNATLLEPTATRIYGMDIPGIDFNFIRFDNDSFVWSFRCSLLIPFALLMLLGGYCFHRFRLLRRSLSPFSGVAA
ncbi:MAG: hypothetical protein KDA77_22795 [Planctomycetaceae bacterium]|nr:hypothetical protein [Planctomycetaceae bacterium]